MATFLLEIVTPERMVFQEQVDSVSVPSITGTLGILPGHVPLFTQLTQGELKIARGKEETLISLGEGFMEVGKDKVTIMVTRALHAEELDEAKILAAQKEAEEALKNPPTQEAAQVSRAMLRNLLVDLKVARRRRSRVAS